MMQVLNRSMRLSSLVQRAYFSGSKLKSHLNIPGSILPGNYTLYYLHNKMFGVVQAEGGHLVNRPIPAQGDPTTLTVETVNGSPAFVLRDGASKSYVSVNAQGSSLGPLASATKFFILGHESMKFYLAMTDLQNPKYLGIPDKSSYGTQFRLVDDEFAIEFLKQD